MDRLIQETPRDAEVRVAKAHMLLADGEAGEAFKQASEAVGDRCRAAAGPVHGRPDRIGRR